MKTAHAILMHGAALVMGFLPMIARAQEAASAREQAESYFESDEPRKAVATLVEAAQKNPKDRVVGALLYSAIRDHVWHPPEILPVAQKGAVKVLAFSADGEMLASGSAAGEVIVSSTEPLDAQAAAAKRIVFKGDGEIIGLAFTADQKRLAVAAKDGPVQVWDLSSAKSVFTGPKPPAETTAFAKAEDADLIAVASAGVVQVIDISVGKITAEYRPPGGKVVALAFSKSGRKMAAASEDMRAHVWETESSLPIGATPPHKSAIRSIAFSWDERYIMTAGDDGTALLSDPESGLAVVPMMNCGAKVIKASISPDGSMVATLLDDSSVLFWDTFTGKRLAFDLREDDPLTDFGWSNSGLRGVTASQGGHATSWTMRNGTRRGETMPHDSAVLVVALSPDSKLLATGTEKGFVRIWRLDNGLPLPTVRSHAARARTAFYSLDGQHLLTTSEDHTALHWLSGRVAPFGTALKHRGKVTCGVFSKDASLILTCDDTGIAQLWNAGTGKPDGDPYQHTEPVNWVDFHPDGKRCVTAAGAVASVWSVADHQKPLAVIRHPGQGESELKCARFSLDGKWLATASTDGSARIWDAATYQPTGVVIDRGFPVLCVRFSPDSSRLVVTGEDAQAVVYDTKTWQPVGVPVLAPGPVFSAAITADNLFLVISSLLLDSVQFFEVATGRPLGPGLSIPSQATCVDYHLPDKVVVVACDDGQVRAVEAPFVSQDVPPWMADFATRLVGYRKTGPDEFERVEGHVGQLRAYLAKEARASDEDFPRLVRWKLSPGTQRNGMPRFTSTLAANIQRRVEERSVDSLFECYEAVSGEPQVLSALSLFLPNMRQGEFIADLVLQMKNVDPVSRCYAAGTLIRNGRSREAQAVMEKALAEAPDDPGVLRRVAKLQAALMNKDTAVQLFEKAIRLAPDDPETHRAYGWALYHFYQPKQAAAQFLRAQEIAGDMIDDIVAGLCLCASAQKNAAEVQVTFSHLVEIDPDWKDAAHIASLRGWSQHELSELERARQTLFPDR